MIHGRIAHQIQVKVNGIHIVALLLNRMNGVEGIGTNQDNIAFITIKIMIVDMKLGASFVDINDFNVCVPVEEDVRLSVFRNGPRQGIGGPLILIFSSFVQLPQIHHGVLLRRILSFFKIMIVENVFANL